MNLSTIKVCIFDVNGVLIDSNRANARAMARSFTDDPATLHLIEELYLELTGIDRGSKIRIIQERVMRRPFEGGEFEMRWERFKRLSRESMARAPLIPGCTEVLARLGELEKIRVALSNTPLAELRETLAARRLDPLLDIIRGGGDWPKSESLVRLLTEFGFEADRCLFMGDGKGDLAAAEHAGVPFVAVDGGTGEFEGRQGFHGPFRNLADWGREVLGMASGP